MGILDSSVPVVTIMLPGPCVCYVYIVFVMCVNDVYIMCVLFIYYVYIMRTCSGGGTCLWNHAER